MGKMVRRLVLWRQDLGRDSAALGLLLGLCLLFFWPLLTPNLENRGSLRAGDFYVQTYACCTYKARELLNAHLPLWNPYVYSGHPFVADLQNSALYPPALLIILFGAPWGYPVLALEIEAIVHVFLAGAFTYFLGRRLFQHRSAALVAAVVFAFGGYLSSFPPLQLPILETAAWLPLVLLLLDVGLERLKHASRLGFWYCALGGAVFGVALLAGHAQTALYLFYVAAAWYAFRAAGRGHPRWRSLFGGFGVFAVTAGGLAAVQLLPSLELMRLSIRASAAYQDLAVGFALKDLLQVVLPGMAGSWSPLYVGILPLAWVVFAWVAAFRTGDASPSRQWQRQVFFWTALACVALLLSFGDGTFLFGLFYLGVPGFDLFRAQERLALMFSLSLALLAGYGLRYFVSRVNSEQYALAAQVDLGHLLAAFLAGMGALAVVLFFGATQASSGQEGNLAGSFLGIVLFLGLVLGAGWLWNAFWRHRRWRTMPATGLLLGLIVLDLFTLNSRTNIQGRLPERQILSSPLIQTLQSAGADQPFRVYHGSWYLMGNYGCVFGVEDTGGASQLQLADYARFWAQLPMERAWELLNVRYVVTWQSELNVPSTVVYHTTTSKGDEVYLHRLVQDAPRAWAVFAAEVVPDGEALARLARFDFDHYGVALLDAPLDPPLTGWPAGEAQIHLLSRAAEEVRLEADMPARGLVVLSEVYYPGWQARVDGQKVPIRRVDTLLRAVELPAGHHEVVMEFRPSSVYLGAGLSLLTFVLLLGYTVWVWAHRC
jgi:hypothetical protein